MCARGVIELTLRPVTRIWLRLVRLQDCTGRYVNIINKSLSARTKYNTKNVAVILLNLNYN